MFYAKLLYFKCMFVLVANDLVYDYTRMDFCNVPPCLEKGSGGEPTGCAKYCRDNKNVTEYVDNRVPFRQCMIDNLNKLRQKVASGEEKSKNAGKAANMNALSYDLGLEHLARCWLHSKYGVDPSSTHYHDKCSIHPKGNTTCGQNILFSSSATLPKDLPAMEKDVFSAWYKEVDELPDEHAIDKFAGGADNDDQYGHFTGLMWATMTHMGCATGTAANIPASQEYKMRSAIVCDFASLEDPKHICNQAGEPVYLRGEPCSKCPTHRKCNKKYNALCGDIAPMPTEAEAPLTGAKGALKPRYGSSAARAGRRSAGGGGGGPGGAGGRGGAGVAGKGKTTTAKAKSESTRNVPRVLRVLLAVFMTTAVFSVC